MLNDLCFFFFFVDSFLNQLAISKIMKKYDKVLKFSFMIINCVNEVGQDLTLLFI